MKSLFMYLFMTYSILIGAHQEGNQILSLPKEEQLKEIPIKLIDTWMYKNKSDNNNYVLIPHKKSTPAISISSSVLTISDVSAKLHYEYKITGYFTSMQHYEKSRISEYDTKTVQPILYKVTIPSQGNAIASALVKNLYILKQSGTSIKCITFNSYESSELTKEYYTGMDNNFIVSCYILYVEPVDTYNYKGRDNLLTCFVETKCLVTTNSIIPVNKYYRDRKIYVRAGKLTEAIKSNILDSLSEAIPDNIIYQ